MPSSTYTRVIADQVLLNVCCRANYRFFFSAFSYIQHRMTIICCLLLLFCGDSITMSWLHRILFRVFTFFLFTHCCFYFRKSDFSFQYSLRYFTFCFFFFHFCCFPLFAPYVRRFVSSFIFFLEIL